MARATRAVSSGTGSMGEGLSDIRTPSFGQMDDFTLILPARYLLDYPFATFANRILAPGDSSFIQPVCDVPLRTQRVVAVCPEAICSGETEPVPTCPAVRKRGRYREAQQPKYSARRSSPGPVPAHRWGTCGYAWRGFSARDTRTHCTPAW